MHQQKKLLVLENETHQQRKVLKVEVENVRINSFFLRLETMNLKCKNCGKEFELFSSEFCCKECVDDYCMRVHPK